MQRPNQQNEEIKEPKKNFPEIEMEVKGPKFNNQKKKSNASPDDEDAIVADEPEVNDVQKAP